jgi:hypothetical protein
MVNGADIVWLKAPRGRCLQPRDVWAPGRRADGPVYLPYLDPVRPLVPYRTTSDSTTSSSHYLLIRASSRSSFLLSGIHETITQETNK